ncbi:MAG: membrane protein [Sporolactobacillus sp.]
MFKNDKNKSFRNEKWFLILNIYVKKWLIFFIGLSFLALGTVAMINAHLGVSTWDVLHIGISRHTGLTVGDCVIIVGGILILLMCLLKKSWPEIGTICNAVFTGIFINLIQSLHFIPVPSIIWERLLLLVVGIFIIEFGAGMYVATDLGAGPRDGFNLALSDHFDRSIRLIRTVIELSVLVAGWVLGGPVYIGTFISLFLVGPILQSSIFFWRSRIKRMTRHLLKSYVQASLK